VAVVVAVRRSQMLYEERREGRPVESYHAHHERTLDDVTVGSNDTRRTDARTVHTRAAVLTIQQVAARDGAVSADEARTTGAPADAVTGAAVETRVDGRAVGRGAGATGVLGRTAAAVSVNEVVARAAVLTRTADTLVQVRLTDRT